MSHSNDLSCLSAAIGFAAIAEADDSSSDEEAEPCRATPRKLPKSREFFSRIEQMDDSEFMSHFAKVNCKSYSMLAKYKEWY